MKNIKWILWAGIIGIGGLTIYYLQKQVKLLVGTLYEFGGLKINKLNMKEVDMVIFYKIMNKSDIGIDLLAKDLIVYLNGMQISKIKSDTKTKLKAKNCVLLPIPVNLSPKELLDIGLSNLRYLVGDKTKAMIQVKGWISIGIGIATLKKVPVDYSMSVQELIDIMKEEDTETIGKEVICK